MHIQTYAILGFNGGKCKELADVSIHFPVNDMQISEDMQIIVGHMLMQYLYAQREVVMN
jgi:D-sedoheptulose 7-phosphate isomerase